MTVTIEVEIKNEDKPGTVMVICQKKWRPIVGWFWNIRRKDNDAWLGFLSPDEMAALLLDNLEVSEINNVPEDEIWIVDRNGKKSKHRVGDFYDYFEEDQ